MDCFPLFYTIYFILFSTYIIDVNSYLQHVHSTRREIRDILLILLLSSNKYTFNFLCNVLQIIVCPFIVFLLAIVLSVLRYTESGYPFGISKFVLGVWKDSWHITTISICLHCSSKWQRFIFMHCVFSCTTNYVALVDKIKDF